MAARPYWILNIIDISEAINPIPLSFCSLLVHPAMYFKATVDLKCM